MIKKRDLPEKNVLFVIFHSSGVKSGGIIGKMLYTAVRDAEDKKTNLEKVYFKTGF